ncbi:hypothetical protein Nepgr_002705 [Nepenthes gracilis]|uniref:Uncharacterized protein n=1 Tax=Nepenthes gracilis TaxID=150966 RepID=A0AAD3P6Q3_NEPGR|nr:hypothetical protein Nepgr_002705 [Nepenthes gracilis]
MAPVSSPLSCAPSGIPPPHSKHANTSVSINLSSRTLTHSDSISPPLTRPATPWRSSSSAPSSPSPLPSSFPECDFPPINVPRRDLPKPRTQHSFAAGSSLDLGCLSASPPLRSFQSNSFKSLLGLGACPPLSPLSSPCLVPSKVDPIVSPRSLDHQNLIDSVPGCCQAVAPPPFTASPTGLQNNLVGLEPVAVLGSEIELLPVPPPCDAVDVPRASSAVSLPVDIAAGPLGISWSSVVEKRTIGAGSATTRLAAINSIITHSQWERHGAFREPAEQPSLASANKHQQSEKIVGNSTRPQQLSADKTATAIGFLHKKGTSNMTHVQPKNRPEEWPTDQGHAPAKTNAGAVGSFYKPRCLD